MDNRVVMNRLYDCFEIREKVREVAGKITESLPEKKIDLVCVLKGAVVFAVDLAREIQDNPVEIHFITMSSYHGGTVQSDGIEVDLDHLPSMEGRNVIVVEDIIDSARSMLKLLPLLRKQNPASLAVASVLSKEEHPEEVLGVNVYYCFRKNDRFLIGYGMDYQGCYRNLPGVYEMVE